jgi:hypothetical protein
MGEEAEEEVITGADHQGDEKGGLEIMAREERREETLRKRAEKEDPGMTGSKTEEAEARQESDRPTERLFGKQTLKVMEGGGGKRGVRQMYWDKTAKRGGRMHWRVVYTEHQRKMRAKLLTEEGYRARNNTAEGVGGHKVGKFLHNVSGTHPNLSVWCVPETLCKNFPTLCPPTPSAVLFLARYPSSVSSFARIFLWCSVYTTLQCILPPRLAVLSQYICRTPLFPPPPSITFRVCFPKSLSVGLSLSCLASASSVLLPVIPGSSFSALFLKVSSLLSSLAMISSPPFSSP